MNADWKEKEVNEGPSPHLLYTRSLRFRFVPAEEVGRIFYLFTNPSVKTAGEQPVPFQLNLLQVEILRTFPRVSPPQGYLE